MLTSIGHCFLTWLRVISQEDIAYTAHCQHSPLQRTVSEWSPSHPAELYTAERSSKRAEKPASAAAVLHSPGIESHPLRRYIYRFHAVWPEPGRLLDGLGPGTDVGAPVAAAAHPPAVSSTAADAKLSRLALAFFICSSDHISVHYKRANWCSLRQLFGSRHACID